MRCPSGFGWNCPIAQYSYLSEKLGGKNWLQKQDGSHGPERGHFRVNPACPPVPRRAVFCTRDIAPSFESQDQLLKGPASRHRISVSRGCPTERQPTPLWVGEASRGIAIHVEYDGQGGRDYVFIVNNENAWNWFGRHICPLSTNFSMNCKSASKGRLLYWRLDCLSRTANYRGGVYKKVCSSPC